MPKYRVKQKAFINQGIVEVGEVVDYEGEPHPDVLEAIDSAASTTADSVNIDEQNAADLKRQQDAAAGKPLPTADSAPLV
jgi:rubrerythrin